MDDQYICRHLRRLVRVMETGRATGFYAKTLIPMKRYEFGTTEPLQRNKVTRAVAIYLCCGVNGLKGRGSECEDS